MPQFPYADGPCKGQTIFAIERPKLGDVVPCGFHFYAFGADGAFHDVGTTDPRPGGAGGINVDSAQVGRAWHRLMHVVSVESAHNIRRAQVARARLRRLTR